MREVAAEGNLTFPFLNVSFAWIFRVALLTEIKFVTNVKAVAFGD
jgi:hypothetical protein